jgi:hypothetical protein
MCKPGLSSANLGLTGWSTALRRTGPPEARPATRQLKIDDTRGSSVGGKNRLELVALKHGDRSQDREDAVFVVGMA